MLDPLVWGKMLKFTSIFNILAIFLFYLKNKGMSNKDKIIYILLVLFTLSCSYRSLNPILESERLCLYDNKYILPIYTRSFATIGEISFMLVIVLVMNNVLHSVINQYPKSKTINSFFYINFILIILITVANFSCWVGTITTDRMWNAIEESLWAVSGTILVIISSVVYLLIKDNNNKKMVHIKPMLLLLLLSALVYTLYLIFVDVPMYYNRSKKYYNKPKYEFRTGVETLKKCKIKTDINSWKEEEIWMSSYFTLGVWLVFSLFIWNKNHNNL